MEAVFMKLKDASKQTGLSVYYLRQGCRNNTVPHICVGTKFLINVDALMEKLDAESRAHIK